MDSYLNPDSAKYTTGLPLRLFQEIQSVHKHAHMHTYTPKWCALEDFSQRSRVGRVVTHAYNPALWETEAG